MKSIMMGVIHRILQSGLILIMTTLSLSWGMNITDLVFGDNTNYLPAAFGDFNSDKLTDLFVVTEDRKTVKVLMSHDEPPLLRDPGPLEGPSCTYESLDIRGIMPGDFDGNGAMDVLLVSSDPATTGSYQAFVLWGNRHDATLECGSEDVPLLNLSGQPLVLDVNGDMIPDLFGENETGNRTFWMFGPDGVPRPEPAVGVDLPRLRHPSSHAFVDLDGDLAADLWVSAIGRFEVWRASGGAYTMDGEAIALPAGMKAVGQTSFADVDLDGDIEALLPACRDELCRQSLLFVYDFEVSEWLEVNVSLKDPLGITWGYPTESSKVHAFGSAVTLRVSDFNLDGYPDFLVTLLDQGGRPQVILMENMECQEAGCTYPRRFVAKWNLFEKFGKTVMGTFCDFEEDGTLDVLLVHEAGDGKYRMSVFKDPSDYDAVFVKVLIPSGRCYEDDCQLKNIRYGTNQPGPSIAYSITTSAGDAQCSRTTQLSQSAHFALQLPYSVFGLGRNWNFVEVMEVGIPKGNYSHTLTSRFTQIIPNSQLIVIPYPMEHPNQWVSKLFIMPSKAMLMTAGALIGTCLFVAIIIGILHRREKQQDKREKQQEAHKFHFDAM